MEASSEKRKPGKKEKKEKGMGTTDANSCARRSCHGRGGDQRRAAEDHTRGSTRQLETRWS